MEPARIQRHGDNICHSRAIEPVGEGEYRRGIEALGFSDLTLRGFGKGKREEGGERGCRADLRGWRMEVKGGGGSGSVWMLGLNKEFFYKVPTCSLAKKEMFLFKDRVHLTNYKLGLLQPKNHPFALQEKLFRNFT